ncbi:MAG: diguanylate cyclase [Rhodospirillaceae bacterium]
MDQLRLSRLLPNCGLSDILDSLPLALFLKDASLRYTWCNRRFEEICGCPRSELPGKLAFEGLRGLESDKARESDLAVLNSGEHRIYDARMSCPCGMSIDARFLKIPAVNRAGDIVGIIGVAIDLTGDRETERKLLHNIDRMTEENARLERIASDLQTSLAFSEDNAAQLVELAEQIDSQKQSIAEQNEQIRRLMYRDDNTGLHNRRYFFDTAPLMLSQPADPARPGLLAIADIDFFKNINDRFGHAAGDAALRGFAQVAADALPETTLFCRIGGEEFAILTAPMSIPEAEGLLNRMREDVAAHHLRLGPEADLNFTVSIGATPLCAVGSLDELLHAADDALYMAKRGGRNRVVIGA